MNRVVRIVHGMALVCALGLALPVKALTGEPDSLTQRAVFPVEARRVAEKASPRSLDALLDQVRRLPFRPLMIGKRPTHRLDRERTPGVVFRLDF